VRKQQRWPPRVMQENMNAHIVTSTVFTAIALAKTTFADIWKVAFEDDKATIDRPDMALCFLRVKNAPARVTDESSAHEPKTQPECMISLV
jgi:hypothetical protein